MKTECSRCTRVFDEDRCSAICPHEKFLTAEEVYRKHIALSLRGKRLRFIHMPPGQMDTRVISVSYDGMVTIEGLLGLFAPHLFVEVPEPVGSETADQRKACD